MRSTTSTVDPADMTCATPSTGAMVQCHQCPALFQRECDLNIHLLLHRKAEQSCDHAEQSAPPFINSVPAHYPLSNNGDHHHNYPFHHSHHGQCHSTSSDQLPSHSAILSSVGPLADVAAGTIVPHSTDSSYDAAPGSAADSVLSPAGLVHNSISATSSDTGSADPLLTSISHADFIDPSAKLQWSVDATSLQQPPSQQYLTPQLSLHQPQSQTSPSLSNTALNLSFTNSCGNHEDQNAPHLPQPCGPADRQNINCETACPSSSPSVWYSSGNECTSLSAVYQQPSELLCTDESLSSNCSSPQLLTSTAGFSLHHSVPACSQHHQIQRQSDAASVLLPSPPNSARPLLLHHLNPHQYSMYRYPVETLPRGFFAFDSLFSPFDQSPRLPAPSSLPPPPSSSLSSPSTSVISSVISGQVSNVTSADTHTVTVSAVQSSAAVYKCVFCCRHFDSADLMRSHMQAVAECRHVCAVCHEMCDSQWQLQLHMTRHHSACSDNGVVSGETGTAVHDEGRAEDVGRGGCYMCGLCGEQFLYSWQHRGHIAEHLCSSRTANSASVVVDLSVGAREVRSAESSGPGSGASGYCSDVTAQSEKMRAKHAAHSSAPTICNLKMKTGISDVSVNAPISSSSSLPPGGATKRLPSFACVKCGVRFLHRTSLTRHWRKKHSVSADAETHPPPSVRPPVWRRAAVIKRLCTCDKCGRIFNSQRRLRWHAEIHARRPHTCATCGRRFVHQSWLTRHVRRQHDGAYSTRGTGMSAPCPVCGKVYMRTSLSRHVRMVHERVQPFECSTCGRRFAAKCNLQAHELSHLSASRRPFRCELCGKGYTTQRDLSEHSASHDERRRLSCGVCGRQFSQRKSLNAHVRDHDGKKEHVCEVCGRKFARRAYLTAHIRVHTGERPHTCSVCERSFANRSNYNAHVRNHSRRHVVNTEL